MKTYEMVALAESDGKIYKCGQMYYNKNKGFHDLNDLKWGIYAFDNSHNEKGDLYHFIMLENWELDDRVRLTKSEIEKELGYKIEIIK